MKAAGELELQDTLSPPTQYLVGERGGVHTNLSRVRKKRLPIMATKEKARRGSPDLANSSAGIAHLEQLSVFPRLPKTGPCIGVVLSQLCWNLVTRLPRIG